MAYDAIMKMFDLRPGLQVLHPQYGRGDVKVLTEKTAEVLFNEGRKTLTEDLVAELKPADPRAKLHLYGKVHARPGRKMGHLSAIGATSEEAMARVLEAKSKL